MTLLEDFPTIVAEMILLLEILFLLVFTEKMFENRRELQEILIERKIKEYKEEIEGKKE